MYAVYSQRHPASPPLSVDGQQEYNAGTINDHTNQYLDNYQQQDDRYGYTSSRNPASDLSFSQPNQFNYRHPAEQRGPAGSQPYLSSPYGSEIEGSYGLGKQNDGADQYGMRYPMDADPVYSAMMSSQQNIANQHQQPVAGGSQFQPYFGTEGLRRNGPGDEAFSDQMSSTRDEVNPLDERFSEQDMNPLDERFSDIAAMNRLYGAGQGVTDDDQHTDESNLIGSNNWNLPSQRRDQNFTDGSLHNSFSHLSIQDNRPPISLSPHPQSRPASAAMQPLNMPPLRSPSVNSQVLDSKWRNPDLREVIDYLNHQNDAIKANAAAYLQHLCYMDDNIKAQTRVLRGIPALVDLVSNPLPEVHRAACGALRNLSYGRANDENKVEIKNAGGITVLVRLLRKTGDNDIREVITGILWNLSSCAELKKPIIDEGVKSIVDAIVMPVAGWEKMRGPNDGAQSGAYRSTVFRNASGVLRNVSSDGEYARKKLRECEGLIGSMIGLVNSAILCSDIDNKSVENCVCLLRNLSYACQEIVDHDYLKKRSTAVIKSNDDSLNCFGGKSKKKNARKDTKTSQNGTYKSPPPQTMPVQGMDMLWNTDIIRLYLQLLQECSNPETLEAAAGAIQNLAACDWQPSVDIRNAVRIEKGIPIIVELIKEPSDKVVCAAATTLRNLALDEKNKQLIGKYVMHDMVSKLPSQERPAELALSNETIAAMEATLYEVIKSSSEFAKLLMQEGGIERLMHIVRSPLGIYSGKVIRYASQLLQKMWSFAEFHEEYKRRGWKQSDFLTSSKSQLSSAENTINRPQMTQSGVSMPGYNDRTMVISRNPQQQRQYTNQTLPEVTFSSGTNEHSRLNTYPSQSRVTQEDIPLTRMEYPVDSSREILYYNSKDHIPQDDEERHNFPPSYNLATYQADPPRYEGSNYLEPVEGYGGPGSRINGSLEESYGSQTLHTQAIPVSGGPYVHREPSGNSFDKHSQDINYRMGYDEYPTIPARDHEPLYSTVTKLDRYGDLMIEGADNRGQDVDSWV